MDNTVKICLIVGAALILLGLIIFTAVMTVYHWDFSKLSTVNYVTNTYPVSEAFTNITINTDTANILIAPSEDGNCQVVCHEPENAKHSVLVQSGALTVELAEKQHWYDQIGINFASTKITVYLPQEQYGALIIKESTGDVELSKDFRFESIEITTSTGDIHSGASASGAVELTADTGDIQLENLSTADLSLSVSTGKITAAGLQCDGDVKIKVSTGKVQLSDITCQSVTSSGNTGKITLTNVIAAGNIAIERSTGDVIFESCDAAEVFVKTSTGDVKGSFRSDKIIFAHTDTGRVDVPKSVNGGKCEITTSTGNIQIDIP